MTFSWPEIIIYTIYIYFLNITKEAISPTDIIYFTLKEHQSPPEHVQDLNSEFLTSKSESSLTCFLAVIEKYNLRQ